MNHKVQLEAVNQDKEEVKQKCLEEINVYRVSTLELQFQARCNDKLRFDPLMMLFTG